MMQDKYVTGIPLIDLLNVTLIKGHRLVYVNSPIDVPMPKGFPNPEMKAGKVYTVDENTYNTMRQLTEGLDVFLNITPKLISRKVRALFIDWQEINDQIRERNKEEVGKVLAGMKAKREIKEGTAVK